MQSLPKFKFSEQERIECRKHLQQVNYSEGMFDLEACRLTMEQEHGLKLTFNVGLLNPLAKKKAKSVKWLEENDSKRWAVLTMDVAVRHFFFA